MKKILFLIFLMSAFSSHAQIVISEKSDNEIIFIEDGDKTSRNHTRVTSNVWKIDVLGPVYGKYGVSYERELISFLAVQASVGMTYYNFSEFYMSLFSYEQSVNFAPGRNLRLKQYRFQNVLNAKPGFFFNAMPKVYVRGDGFEGFYLGLGFNYSKWNFKETERDVDYNAIDNNQVGGEFALGYQVINGKMALDFSTSFGVHRNSVNFFDSADRYRADYLSFYYGLSLKLGRYF